MNNDFELWTIYKNPSDYPGLYVARKWILNEPTDTVFTAFSLNEIRQKLPLGLTKLCRSPGDDPCIVETWI